MDSRLRAVQREFELRRGRQFVRLHAARYRILVVAFAEQRAHGAIQRRAPAAGAVLEPEIEAAELAEARDGREVGEERHAIARLHERHAVRPLDEFRCRRLAIAVVLQLDEEHADAFAAADEAEAGDFEHRVARTSFCGACR